MALRLQLVTELDRVTATAAPPGTIFSRVVRQRSDGALVVTTKNAGRATFSTVYRKKPNLYGR